ncbi:CLUMA_CG012048, isoform A [Clunio marinus]|uniref:CLUMA_CG012048, isoform A n=1 Tax=Clunio marinus TaxID=568069 RepID=A0A1J1IGB9_9DIPT|nr:CLUMA_CG012048, isoform A [Clunio marinus]
MSWNKVNFCVIFVVSALSLFFVEGKLQVDIHYESRCPDSSNFMLYQLRRVYPSIKDNVVINFVPFGPKECEGNKFQSCVLDVIGPNQDKQTSFVICAMDFQKNARNCAQNMGLDMNKIDDCTKSQYGTNLQIQAERFSSPIISKSNFVPTIVYNGIYKAGDHWASLDDFSGVLKKLSTF